jgi:Fe2+ transport protein
VRIEDVRSVPRCGAIALAAAGLIATPGCGGAATAGSTVIGPSTVTTNGNGGTGGSTPKAMPIVSLGQVVWQGMRIQARAMAPSKFLVLTGTRARMVTPTAKDSMHLMVTLSDADTGVPIPYASVWATITKAGRVVYDDRQWPMLSRYMGTHYGNNVALPGPGTYSLTLLVGPPQSARHMEYAHVWLKPHRVDMTFHWKAGM